MPDRRSSRNEPLPLIVPLTVEALPVTTRAAHHAWSVTPMNYHLLDEFQSVEPGPFRDVPPRRPDDPQKMFTGVLVHWALPDGVTHGRETGEGGPIEFPAVPDRWLVERRWIDGEDHPRQRAWVVESDFLSPNEGANGFPDPETLTGFTRIGRAVPLEDWRGGEPGLATGFRLEAIGPGDATFASYIANVRDVFSFWDLLEDGDGARGPLSYCVCGWYADPQDDVLRGRLLYGPRGWTTAAEWSRLLEDLGWWVEGADGEDDLPSEIVCQGTVFDVPWEGPDGPFHSGVPTREVGVAVGNTATDAFAALVAERLDREGEDGARVAEILEAFQHELLPTLDQQGGAARRAAQIQGAEFGSTPAGSLWQLAAPERPGPFSPEDARPEPAPTSEQARLLRTLNDRQLDLDGATRELGARRWRLHAAWWKRGRFIHSGAPPPTVTLPELQAAYDLALAEATEAVGREEESRDRRDEALREMCASLNGELVEEGGVRVCRTPERGLQLLESAAPRLWSPNDPVLVLEGAWRGTKHGEDGRFREDGRLLCRRADRIVRSLEVMVDGRPVIVEPDPIPLPGSAPVPPGVAPLLLESRLLDPGFSRPLARRALTTLGISDEEPRLRELAGAIARRQTLVWNADLHPVLDRAILASLAGLEGEPPSKVAVEAWSAPWSPLYLDWEIRWRPTSQDPRRALDGWRFDGHDFVWEGGAGGSNESIYQGRALLTPKLVDELGERLEAFLALENEVTDPPTVIAEVLPALRRLREAVERWDLLSQSLDGFGERLIMRRTFQHRNPPAELEALLGDLGYEVPDPGGAEDVASSRFYPIRAGHFTIERIWIVDDFGQVLDLTSRQGRIRPIRARGVVTPDDPYAIQLPPRIVQPGGLQLRFVATLDDRVDAEVDPRANPVSGWILFNRLDNGLAVYDADGEALGSLLRVGPRGEKRARWTAAPGRPVPVGAPPEIADAHLRRFVEAILYHERSGDVLADVFEVIDEALWDIQPEGGRNDSALSLLIGRPLALVRARVWPELGGPPVRDETWAATTHPTSKGFTEVPLPIRLGSRDLLDDGLVGFYRGGDYRALHSLYGSPDRSSYVVREDLHLPLDEERSEAISLLLDPRGEVHAATGVWPIKSLLLPGRFVESPLARLLVTFQVAPVLGDPHTVALPLPAEIEGVWSWIQQTGLAQWREVRRIDGTEPQAKLPDDPRLVREGWLVLRNADDGP